MQLVFDTNILVDAILARGHFYTHAIQTLELVERGELEGWYAPHCLTTVYYMVEKTLANEAENRAQASGAARAVVAKVFGLLKPLPQVGNEFLDLRPQPGDDLEDLLIVTLAVRYLPNPLIVTRDKWMLAADRPWQAAHPKEIVEAGESTARIGAQPDQPVSFVDLKAQQRMLWPALGERLQGVLHHCQYILGPEVREMEDRLADYTGARHCIAVASGTEALLISLMALGIGPGDEVITTPFTFVATVEVIVLLGATPIFVDIEPDTCNLDAGLIESKITANTKAIMPVSLYGQPADMDEINAIAARHGDIPVIEDAAQSFGATYNGKRSGNLSTIGTTSFFPSKPLGCYGDGGAIFTSDEAIAQACREIRVHGQSKRYVHSRIGVGGRMDTLQCAVVLAKLDRFDHEIAQRQAVARRYRELLTTGRHENTRLVQPSGNPGAPSCTRISARKLHDQMVSARERSIEGYKDFHSRALEQDKETLLDIPRSCVSDRLRQLPWSKPDRTSVFAQYTILVEDRDTLQSRLDAAGVPTAVHYPIPLNEQPAYAHLADANGTPVAAEMSRQVLCLPMHADLNETEQRHIVTTILEAMQ